jgi:hypothetical protein
MYLRNNNVHYFSFKDSTGLWTHGDFTPIFAAPTMITHCTKRNAQHITDLYLINTGNVSSVWFAFGERGETNDLVIMILIINSGCHGGAVGAVR